MPREWSNQNCCQRRKYLILVLTCLIIFLILFVLFSNFYDRRKFKNLDFPTASESGVYYSDKCFVPRGRESCAPQYIIAGAMKTGTTSMFSYLLQHPQILPLRKFNLDDKGNVMVLAEKEVRFFMDPNWTKLGKELGVEKAINNYFDLFEEIPPPYLPIHPDPEVEKNRGCITGEATPLYICYPGVATRIYNILPYVKIIILLRNPVDRAYSEYWFRRNLKSGDQTKLKNGLTHDLIFQQCMNTDMEILKFCGLDEFVANPSIEEAEEIFKCYRNWTRQYLSWKPESEACQNEPSSRFCLEPEVAVNCVQHSVGNSLYYVQLFEWVKVIHPGLLKVIKSEHFYSNTSQVMEDVSSFLSLYEPDFDWNRVTTNSVFNIVNPNTKTGLTVDLVTHSKGLNIGASTEGSEYPELDPVIRSQLMEMFRPYNLALSELLNQEEFIFEDDY